MCELGVIVIGRNEGSRLGDALDSAIEPGVDVVYVDSGSTDGSVEVARSLGVAVHKLDPTIPFSPSRARREGVDLMLQRHPRIKWIQFLDGDCVLSDGWLSEAMDVIESDAQAGIVCGILLEDDPESSVYNKMSPQTWKMPIGEIRTCGGIFVIRRDVYESTGGFNAALITHEEDDLCRRVRAGGYRILRIDSVMARHDSGMLRFTDWWNRAVWGGYGDALGIAAGPMNEVVRRRLVWYLFWAVLVPVMFCGGAALILLSPWFAMAPLVCIVAHAAVFTRLSFARLRQGSSLLDSMQFAAFWNLRIFACGLGFLWYWVGHATHWRRPDPHARAAP